MQQSPWAAITAIAPKIGCTPETLRVWYQKYLDKQNPVKVQQLSDQERIKQLEREKALLHKPISKGLFHNIILK